MDVNLWHGAAMRFKMITPPEVVRSLMADVDSAARTYADACIAYQQADGEGRITTENRAAYRQMSAAHDVLMARAKSVAEIL